MRELNSCESALRTNEIRDGLPGINVRVEINSCVGRRNSSSDLNGSRFCDDERGAADGSAAEMNEMPGLRMTIHGGVFAHRRDEDAIFQINFAEANRREKGGHFPWLFQRQLLGRACPEQRGAHADLCCAFFNSNFEVVRHAYGKRGQLAVQLFLQTGP